MRFIVQLRQSIDCDFLRSEERLILYITLQFLKANFPKLFALYRPLLAYNNSARNTGASVLWDTLPGLNSKK